ncbi:MAG: right-handed parallel beta-helix repeat-containing protein [Bacteroidetes bacterium]|nr:right-handed parallel beta-helix repeat-containing protein [Bacteroidota bacterium]
MQKVDRLVWIVFLFVLLSFEVVAQSTQIAPDVIHSWSLAGVQGGIPSSKILRIKKTITPADNIQKAINVTAASGGGIVLLKAGKYPINATIHLKPGVFLKGIHPDSVTLGVNIHGYHYTTRKPRQCALALKNIENAAIENITIKYTGADFEPLDKDSLNAPWDKAVFHIPELRDTSLFVEHIWIDSSKNCWVRNCKILWAGSDPIRITNSEHITCTGNFIDRSYNKCDGGMGYYNIINSKYVLVYNEHIKRIRHFAIQNGSMYNVVYNNYLEVDINFHNGDSGYNLIEQNTIRIPQWHSWHCFQRGDPRQHQVPGKFNLLYRNVAHHKTGNLEFRIRM